MQRQSSTCPDCDSTCGERSTSQSTRGRLFSGPPMMGRGVPPRVGTLDPIYVPAGGIGPVGLAKGVFNRSKNFENPKNPQKKFEEVSDV